MFVTLQTYHGILVAVMSTVKAVKFLLQNGCLFILTETFCQDPVGEYLSIRRQLGKRNYIPDMAKFDYNESKIRIQTDVFFTSGNMQGK